MVTNLPRSIRDHLTNQPSFGPDGRLYFGQGADTAMGEPDAAWGYRSEHQFSASIVAVDVNAIGNNTVNVKTRDAGGSYDPLAAGAPVTLYATGVRNSYNVTWHSNGHLYAPTNGSAAGGNTPQSPQPGSAEFGNDRTDLGVNGPYAGAFVPGLNNVQQTQHDFLYDVQQGGYYGAPNPTRDEWVMNGGNPTSGVDVNEVPAYPVGTQPDRNYRGSAYDFGLNYSPDGTLEYQGDAFGGALDGKLLVTRYSGGDDVIALTVDDNGQVLDTQTGITGLTGFTDPLDLTQRSDGSLYVAEFGAQQITLVRPVESGGKAEVRGRRTYFNAAAGAASDAHSFTVRNAGDQPLILSGNTLTFTGADRAVLQLHQRPGHERRRGRRHRRPHRRRAAGRLVQLPDPLHAPQRRPRRHHLQRRGRQRPHQRPRRPGGHHPPVRPDHRRRAGGRPSRACSASLTSTASASTPATTTPATTTWSPAATWWPAACSAPPTPTTR